MVCRQPAESIWKYLPGPLAAQILQQAFEDSGWMLRQYLNQSLVCRDWRAMMGQEEMDVALTTPHEEDILRVCDQCVGRALHTKHGDEVLIAAPHAGIHHPRSRRIGAATAGDDVRSIHTVRELSLWDGINNLRQEQAVLHVQSKALLASLPTTLEVLYLHFPNFFKGPDFACLLGLRELYVDVELPQDWFDLDWGDCDDGASDDFVRVHMAGLPATLQTLEVTAIGEELLDLVIASGPPSAVLRLGGSTVVLTTPGHGPSSSDTLSVQLLELEPAAIMLCTLEPDDFGEHDMKTVAGRQSCLGQYLADWIAQCGAAAVRLYSCGGITLTLNVPVNQGTNREVEYSGRELLDAVRGPCQQHGIRCTDVDGFLLFEHM